ncbi:hypothetical protein D3C86_2249250 [compost metagenome]
MVTERIDVLDTVVFSGAVRHAILHVTTDDQADSKVLDSMIKTRLFAFVDKFLVSHFVLLL